jgi:hypothetical protein
MKVFDNEFYEKIKQMRKRTYDNTRYKEKIQDGYDCPCCFKTISANYKNKHLETRVHKKNFEIVEKFKEEEEERKKQEEALQAPVTEPTKKKGKSSKSKKVVQ